MFDSTAVDYDRMEKVLEKAPANGIAVRRCNAPGSNWNAVLDVGVGTGWSPAEAARIVRQAGLRAVSTRAAV